MRKNWMPWVAVFVLGAVSGIAVSQVAKSGSDPALTQIAFDPREPINIVDAGQSLDDAGNKKFNSFEHRRCRVWKITRGSESQVCGAEPDPKRELIVTLLIGDSEIHTATRKSED